MATTTTTTTAALPAEPTTLYYYLEPKDGGIQPTDGGVQTYPGTAFEKRRKHVPHDMHVKDLRPARSDFNIDECGFQLVDHVTKVENFADEENVSRVYYQECIDLIKKTQVLRPNPMLFPRD